MASELTRTVLCEQYELLCYAQQLGGGGYIAALTIAEEHGGERRERKINIGSPVYATPAEALDHAERSGRHWVENHG